MDLVVPPPPAPATPFVVAHRAGNDLSLLRRAADAGARLIEADVRLFAGRLEVRHLKTVGPLPLLWDTWTLAPPWAPRLLAQELLAVTPPGCELMLDLKGRDVRLAHRLAAALGEHHGDREVTVCSRSWALLEPLRDVPGVRLVHSVGSRRQLDELRRRFAGARLAGVSIHRKLLDPATVADLRARAAMVLSWPVATAAEARELGAWGVSGVITERFEDLVVELAA